MQGHGTPHWTELRVWHLDSALNFYQSVFGWEFDRVPRLDGGDYYLGKLNGIPVAGIFQMSVEIGFPAETPSHWLSYFSVADLDESLKSVMESGGMVMVPPMDMPGVGRFCSIQDSASTWLGLIQPA